MGSFIRLLVGNNIKYALVCIGFLVLYNIYLLRPECTNCNCNWPVNSRLFPGRVSRNQCLAPASIQTPPSLPPLIEFILIQSTMVQNATS